MLGEQPLYTGANFLGMRYEFSLIVFIFNGLSCGGGALKKVKKSKIIGSSDNPVILKHMSSERLLTRYFKKSEWELRSDTISNLNGRDSRERFIANVISNSSLSKFEICLAMWFRMHLEREGSVFQLCKRKKSRLDAYIGEHVKAIRRPPQKESEEQDVDESVKALNPELIDIALMSIEDRVDAYRFVQTTLKLDTIIGLISATYYSLGLQVDDEDILKGLTSKVDKFDTLEHLAIKMLLSLCIRVWAEQYTASFCERISNGWSRIQIHDFALEHMHFDKESLDEFEGLTVEEMVEKIYEFFVEKEVQQLQSASAPHLVIHVKGMKPLRYNYEENAKSRIKLCSEICENLNAKYEISKFYTAVTRLHDYGYITLTPLDEKNSKLGTESRGSEKTKLPDFFHVRCNSYMGKKDFIRHWPKINEKFREIKSKEDL